MPTCLKYNPQLWRSKTLVFYTHPKDIGMPEAELINPAIKYFISHRICADQKSIESLDLAVSECFS